LVLLLEPKELRELAGTPAGGYDVLFLLDFHR
jgi:hypothetical protein